MNDQEAIEKLNTKEWRISHLYKIIDINDKKVVFKKNRAQEHFDKNKWYRNILLKSRRIGFTTFEAIDMFDDTLFNKNIETLLIAHKKEEAIKIFDKKIHFAWKNINPDLREYWGVDANRANELKFDFGKGNDSSISVASSGRSGTYKRVHISEFAKLCKEFPGRASEVITGTIPAVTSDGRVDIESTAEGDDGDFYDMFWEAWERGDPKFPTEYKAHFYNWQWDDNELAKISQEQIDDFVGSQEHVIYHLELNGSFKEYQEKHKLSDREITYYYTKYLSLNRKFNKLFQEYPTTPEEAFTYSGVKLFDAAAIDKQKQNEREGVQVGEWIYYEDYTPGHVYGLGADVGHGIGRDSSTIVIMDFTPLVPIVVAEYANNEIDATVFAHEVKSGATRYGNCLVAVENNDRGYATNVELARIYHKIYTRIVQGEIEERKTKEYGWRTTAATKPKMMLDIKTAYNDSLIIVPSKKINREARTYDENDLNVIKFDEEQTRHWDRLIALAICWQLRTQVSHSADDSDDLGGGDRADMS